MKKTVLSIWLLAIILASCSIQKPNRMSIAISKASPVESYGNYARWIHSVDSTAVCLDMYNTTLDSALLLLDGCSGLLLSGGPDVFPGRYNMEQDIQRCGTIDYKRDSLEVALISKALDMKMPILGICRGEQLLNVYFGGSLIVDIPEDIDTDVLHRCDDYLSCFHEITVDTSSFLYEISGAKYGTVTTNHHQAVATVAGGLKVSARSPDGLVEAIEYMDALDKGFLLGVQWHPERMGKDNLLSMPIALRFIDECRNYFLEQKK